MFIEKIIAEVIHKVSTQQKIPANDVAKVLGDIYPELVDDMALMLKDALEKDIDSYLKDQYEFISQFESRLFKSWRVPLMRLDSLITMCMEIGSEINDEYRKSRKPNKSVKLEVMTRLHSRAAQQSREICHLLKGGYADGAMARWRSLHETAVMLKFLCQEVDVVAKRYLDHQHVDSYKAAKQFNEYSNGLGYKQITKSQMNKIERQYNEVLKKHGDDFSQEYGWAASVIGKKRPNFFDIESKTELSILRPYYKFSSTNVHAGSKSIGFKLGLSLTNEDILLAGPSNEGFIDPVQCTSLSLIQSTCALISALPSLDRRLFENVLWLWHEEIKSELIVAERKLIRSGRQKSKRK
jgi:hypothetical protein